MLTACCPQAHRPSGWLEAKGWCCWLLITRPPTNQKNVHKLTTHPNRPPYLLIFKSLSLKASGEFGPLEHSLPGLLAWHLQWTLHFASPRPAVCGLASPRMSERTPLGGDPSTPAVVSAPHLSSPSSRHRHDPRNRPSEGTPPRQASLAPGLRAAATPPCLPLLPCCRKKHHLGANP